MESEDILGQIGATADEQRRSGEVLFPEPTQSVGRGLVEPPCEPAWQIATLIYGLEKQ